jgi:hypothetical protein
MKKPFVLYKMKKNASVARSRRLIAPMQKQVTQCEWFEPHSGSCPESALGMAVLQRAVLDLITPGIHAKDRHNAIEWISGNFGEDYERDYALSFSRIVEGFTNIGVDEFRNKIFSFAETAQQKQEVADGFRFQRS